MPLIYKGIITYFPKFEPEEVFMILMRCEKLSSYKIGNLDNTYIFFNP